MTEEPKRAILIKFGKKEHLEQLRAGTLFMNGQEYFSKLENDVARSDPFEGTDQIHQPKDIKELRIKDKATGKEFVFKSENFAGPLRMSFGKRAYHLFCMYAITELSDLDTPVIDERNFAFGDSFTIVTDTPAFLKRVSTAIDLLGFGSDAKFVEYYDEKEHSGETGPFRKSSAFSYQREFRLAIYPALIEPLRLSVGDLTDITTPINALPEINKIVSFGRKPPTENDQSNA